MKFMGITKTKSALALALCLMPALLAGPRANAAGRWEQPAAQLAAQVAEILGAGQVQLLVTNRSTVPATEVPAIRRLLEQDLRARGVVASGAESANLVRVTLSENTRERLWVAEVIEGNRTQVAMVHADRDPLAAPAAEAGMALRKQRIWSSPEAPPAPLDLHVGPVLAALETKAALIVLEQDEIAVFAMTAAEWHEGKSFPLERQHASSRDPRGMLIAAEDGMGFAAYTAGTGCNGSYTAATDNSGQYGDWSVRCHESDDPWPVISGSAASGQAGTGAFALKAFFNASRDFFTGVVTPNQGAELMPFYSIAALPRPTLGYPALLLNGVDGKVRLAEAGALKTVSGTRDWGSDFAAMRSSCGAGIQIVASASGDAESDNVRAYELPGQEAIAVSAPLEMGGAVTSLTAAPDGASVWAVVRKANNQYEVDRVTVLCP
jgi:hypothetical protein